MRNRFVRPHGAKSCVYISAILCLLSLSSRAVDIVAHRGGYTLTPENTLSAFRSCAGYAEWIEFDVHTTVDGQLVVIHDSSVDRTTSGSGIVSNMTLAEIKALDAGIKFSPAFLGETIPTLVETLQAMPPGTRPIIDLKRGTADAVIRAIQDANTESSVLLSCLDWSLLATVRSKNARIALSAIGSGTLTTNTLAWMQNTGFYGIIWEKASITPSLIEAAHAHGMRVFAWTLNSLQTRDYMTMGLDGILVNDPRLAFMLRNGTKPTNEHLAKGIRAYWKLDEGAAGGLVMTDAGGINTDWKLDEDQAGSLTMIDVEGISSGLFSGTASPPLRILGASTRMGGAVVLDGSQNYIAIPNNPQTDIGTNAATLALWVKLTALPSGISEPFAGIYDSEQDAYILYMDRAARELRFKLTDASNQAARVGIPESLLGTGVWHHIAGVYDGSASPAAGQAMIYLDGRLVAVKTGSDTSLRYGLVRKIRPGQIAAIGRNGTANHSYFQGAVDDVAIWGRALPPTEIRHIHAAGTASRPLEDLIMSIRISNASPIHSNQAELRFMVAHAITADRQFRLGYAHHPAGPYTEQPADLTIEGNSVRCQIQFSDPVGNTPRFYRIESP